MSEFFTVRRLTTGVVLAIGLTATACAGESAPAPSPDTTLEVTHKFYNGQRHTYYGTVDTQQSVVLAPSMKVEYCDKRDLIAVQDDESDMRYPNHATCKDGTLTSDDFKN